MVQRAYQSNGVGHPAERTTPFGQLRLETQSFGSEYQELKSRVHNRLLDLLDFSLLDSLDRPLLRQEIVKLVEQILGGETVPLNSRERERLVGLLRDAAAPWEVDVALEMSGHADALDAALRAVRRGGHVILFGLPKQPAMTFERYSEDVIFGGVTLKGIIGRKLYDTWQRTRASP